MESGRGATIQPRYTKNRRSKHTLSTPIFLLSVIPPHVYADWAPRFAAARAAVVDRDAAVEAVGAELERELTLLGATAIEDRLQEVWGREGETAGQEKKTQNLPTFSPLFHQGVGDTIHTLAQAGIRVWVLTGDRLVSCVGFDARTRPFPPRPFPRPPLPSHRKPPSTWATRAAC